MRRLSVLVPVLYYLASLTNVQVTEGQTFPGGVIVSVNPGVAPSPAPAPPPPELAPEIDDGEQARQPAIEALCTARVDKAAWDAAELQIFTSQMSVIN